MPVFQNEMKHFLTYTENKVLDKQCDNVIKRKFSRVPTPEIMVRINAHGKVERNVSQKLSRFLLLQLCAQHFRRLYQLSVHWAQ